MPELPPIGAVVTQPEGLPPIGGVVGAPLAHGEGLSGAVSLAKDTVGAGLERLVEWLPAIGGTAGGVMGSAGGPPGAVMLAALGGAAGEAYRQLIHRARGQAAPQTSGEAATGIGVQAAVQGAVQGAGEALAPGMTALGERIMQSAVKPGLKVLLKGVKAGDTTPQVVRTLLDQGVNVTPGGVAKLQSLIDATNQEIAAAIAPTTATVPALKVASRLSDTAREFGRQVNPGSDLRSISRVGEEFLATQPRRLTVQEAQALKTGTYKRIGEKYGKVGPAGIEAQKALARGLKEEIAAEVPGISALNATEGKLLEALHVVGKRVALAGNRDPVGFAWVAHNPVTFLAALFDRSPAVKSLVARGLYHGAGAAAKVAPSLIRVAVTSLTSESPDAGLAQASVDDTSSGR